jgi:hypothetical protein
LEVFCDSHSLQSFPSSCIVDLHKKHFNDVVNIIVFFRLLGKSIKVTLEYRKEMLRDQIFSVFYTKEARILAFLSPGFSYFYRFQHHPQTQKPPFPLAKVLSFC